MINYNAMKCSGAISLINVEFNPALRACLCLSNLGWDHIKATNSVVK